MVATPYNKKANPVFLVDQSDGSAYKAGTGTGSATAANQVLQLAQETAINTVLGTVTASPTANTIADRLKALLTGIVLAAGSAIIGKVGIDQTTPGTTNGVTLTGDSYNHITTTTTTTVKNAPGTVKSISVNTKGTVASVVTLKDNATTLAIIDSLNLSGTWTFNIACATSIVVVTTGAPDITVTYQ